MISAKSKKNKKKDKFSKELHIPSLAESALYMFTLQEIKKKANDWLGVRGHTSICQFEGLAEEKSASMLLLEFF